MTSASAKSAKTVLRFLLVMLMFGCLWEGIARVSGIPRPLFPPPSAVLMALWDMLVSQTMPSDIGTSLWRAYAGFLCGSFLGIFVGLLTGRFRGMNYVLSPALNLLRQLPPVAMIPLMIVWFGIGDASYDSEKTSSVCTAANA